MSVAVAVFPKLATEAGDEDRSQMRRTLDTSAAATILVTLPASVGLIVLGDDVVRVLFFGGRFVEADVWPTVLTASCLVAGLPFLGLAQLYARAFYAVGDMAVPARTAAWLVVVNVALSVGLLLTTGLGTAALTLASSLTSIGNAVLLARAFRRHAAPAHDLGAAWLRSVVATAVMAVALPFLRVASPGDRLLVRAFGNLVLPITVGIVVYLVAHRVMRSPELRALRWRRSG
jgi:putative peptidoglycan lipid II flippase